MAAKIQRRSVSSVTAWIDMIQVLLIGGFVGCLVVSQFLAFKLAGVRLPVMGEMIFPAGVISYSLTFLFTDLLSECYGKRASVRAVAAGLFANLLLLGFFQIASLLPDASIWHDGESFHATLGITTRITYASIAAYLVSQSLDIFIFHRLRDRTRGKQLWLRNNVATMTAQSIDTLIFITIAFYGTGPIVKLLIGQILLKWVIALIDTPLVYFFTAIIGPRPVRSKIF